MAATARVDVLKEVRSGGLGQWQLCLHWCRYRHDEGQVEYGYRFVWRRPGDGSIQAARGQARLPSLDDARSLMEAAVQAGWGDRKAEVLDAAMARLRNAGCVVTNNGHVAPPPGRPDFTFDTSDLLSDAKLVQAWGN
jgi:hypothetical protein